MKSQIKDIVIGIFAVIGFTAIVMGFTDDDTIIQQPSDCLEFKVKINKLESEIAALKYDMNKSSIGKYQI